MNIMTRWCAACAAVAVTLPAHAQPMPAAAPPALQPQPQPAASRPLLPSQPPAIGAPVTQVQTSVQPDPLDPAARTLPLKPPTALSHYQADTATKAGGWREANDTVGRVGGWKAYARMGDEPGGHGNGGDQGQPEGDGRHQGHRRDSGHSH